MNILIIIARMFAILFVLVCLATFLEWLNKDDEQTYWNSF